MPTFIAKEITLHPNEYRYERPYTDEDKLCFSISNTSDYVVLDIDEHTEKLLRNWLIEKHGLSKCIEEWLSV